MWRQLLCWHQRGKHIADRRLDRGWTVVRQEGEVVVGADWRLNLYKPSMQPPWEKNFPGYLVLHKTKQRWNSKNRRLSRANWPTLMIFLIIWGTQRSLFKQKMHENEGEEMREVPIWGIEKPSPLPIWTFPRPWYSDPREFPNSLVTWWDAPESGYHQSSFGDSELAVATAATGLVKGVCRSLETSYLVSEKGQNQDQSDGNTFR